MVTILAIIIAATIITPIAYIQLTQTDSNTNLAKQEPINNIAISKTDANDPQAKLTVYLQWLGQNSTTITTIGITDKGLEGSQKSIVADNGSIFKIYIYPTQEVGYGTYRIEYHDTDNLITRMTELTSNGTLIKIQ